MVVKWILIVLAAIIVGGGLFITFGLYRISQRQPETSEIPLGLKDGRLSACPETPNCVATQADPEDETHYVEPIPFSGSGENLLGYLAEWISRQPRAEVVTRRDGYLRAVFSSRLFGFKDDVEVYVPEGRSVVHLRSASRVGKSDMGVNKARYQAIRDVIEASVE